MKRFASLICLVLGLFVAFSLTGCGDDDSFKIKLSVDGKIWKVVESDEINELPTPTKAYFDFEGWYLDYQVELNDIQKSCTVYAKWSVKEGYECHEVMSNAMYPTMKGGDYVVVDTTDTTYEVSDIVMFEISGLKVIQRVVAIEGDTLSVKGDQNAVSTEIDASSVVGVVCKVLDVELDLVD